MTHLPASIDNGQARRVRTLLTAFGLIAAVYLVYGQTFDFAFISFDDAAYVTENWQVRQGLNAHTALWAFTTFAAANWHPLTWLSLLLDNSLYGLDAGGYHLTNVLLHAATTVAVFFWLKTATGAFWRAALVAALFALHPMHVESVAWVAERKDVLSGFFFVATLAAYTRWTRRGGAGGYALTLGLYLLGLLAKPMLVTLPAVLLLVDHWPLARTTPWTRRIWEKLPFFVLSLASCVVTFIAQRDGGAVVSLQLLTPVQRLLNAILGYGDYLRLTFVPLKLSVYYPARDLWPAGEVALAAAVLGVISAAVVYWRPKAPYLLTGWLWFVGMLVPVIGLVQVGAQAIADRYVYLPHLGVFMGFVWGAAALTRRWQASTPARLALGGAAALILVVSAQEALTQAAYWRSGFTLYSQSLRATAPSLRVYQLLGDDATDAHNYRHAEHWFRRGLELQPGDPHCNRKLAALRILQGRWIEAAQLLTPVLEAGGDAASFNNFGFALLHITGQSGNAARAFEESIRLQPTGALAHFNLAELRFGQRAWAQAIQHYEYALQIRPNWPDVLLRAAELRATCPEPALRDGHRALEHLQKAATLLGENNRRVLDARAAAFAELGRWPEAVTAAEAVLQSLPATAAADLISQHQQWLEAYQAGRPRRL